uniref:Uncharacterized protein n=1 Tax=Wuchereria bancrofti TaxID=6293 RepID=A0A1I8EWV5_WUCBA
MIFHEYDLFLNPRQCDNSLQLTLTTSFSHTNRFILCKDPPKVFHFCYYSVRVMEGYWKLKRDFDTNNRAVIQNCMNAASYTYGFTDDQRMKVKHLIDIFYYCCKDCSFTNGMNDEEIINFIGNLLLKNLPKSSNDTFNYVPGESLPYCLLEDGALAKSLADVVSMNFTEICPKSECIYYLSPLEFFVYCCCDINYELCAYTSDEQLLSYASKNALTWATNPLIRSFRETLIYDIKTDVFTEISGRPWTYRKYVYSKPTVDQRTGNVTSSGNWKNEDFTVKIGKRKMLAEPQKFCYYMPSLQFTQTDRKPPTSLEVRYGSDTEELCKREGCNIKTPTCLQDLISTDHVIATFKCCCNTDDLCNHLGNKYFQEIKQVISATNAYRGLFIFCTRK